MARTALDMDTRELEKYSPGRQIEPAESDARMARARSLARDAARLLRNQFHASRIVLFGSLAHGLWFTPWSDIDLAAWDILPQQFYQAVAALAGLDREWTINLVDAATASPDLRHTIEEEGVEL